jgi:hypothetical protein
MATEKKSKTGIVVYADPEIWLKIEQMVLDYKKEGIKTTKAELASKLMEIGYWKELEQGTRIR